MSLDQDQSPGQTVSDTNNGFIVGIDPPAAPQGGLVAGSEVSQSQQVADQSANNIQLVENLPNLQPGTTYYTEEDVEKIRSEEKNKLYGRISDMDKQLSELHESQVARDTAEQETKDALLAEARRVEEEGMEIRDLMARKEQEFNERLDEIQANAERERALFEQERRLSEVDEYKRNITEQNAEYIIPELRDLITGSSLEEIDRSIDEMKARTSAIMQNINDVASQQRQSMRGVTPLGAPPVGPMEQSSSYENLSADDISNMSMEQYRQHRDRLLRAASPNFRG